MIRGQTGSLSHSIRHELKHAADVVEKGHISYFGALRHFIQPTNCGRLKARLVRVFVRENDLDLDLYGKLPALHPALPLFTSISHINLENKQSLVSHDRFSPTTTR